MNFFGTTKWFPLWRRGTTVSLWRHRLRRLRKHGGAAPPGSCQSSSAAPTTQRASVSLLHAPQVLRSNRTEPPSLKLERRHQQWLEDPEVSLKPNSHIKWRYQSSEIHNGEKKKKKTVKEEFHSDHTNPKCHKCQSSLRELEHPCWKKVHPGSRTLPNIKADKSSLMGKMT